MLKNDSIPLYRDKILLAQRYERMMMKKKLLKKTGTASLLLLASIMHLWKLAFPSACYFPIAPIRSNGLSSSKDKKAPILGAEKSLRQKTAIWVQCFRILKRWKMDFIRIELPDGSSGSSNKNISWKRAFLCCLCSFCHPAGYILMKSKIFKNAKKWFYPPV